MKIYTCLFIFYLLILTSCSIEELKKIYDDDNKIKSPNERSFQRHYVSTTINNTHLQRIKSFTGIKTIGTINKNGALVFNLLLEINSGRFKLVLVDKNNVVIICDNNINDTLDFTHLDNGKYILKMVGDEANINMRISFSEKIIKWENRR